MNTRGYSPYTRALLRTRREGGCLLYTGAGRSSNKSTHGKMTVCIDGKRRCVYAHRVVYEFHHGPVPDGQVVRHLCNNARCVEITHLTLGTPSENMQDMMRAQRGRNQFQPQNVELDDCPF